MSASDRLPPFPDEGHSPPPRKLARVAQVEHLARLPLFEGCSKRELRHLAASTRLDQVEAGQPLFVEGQPSREAYVIVAGRVVVRRKGRKIAELGPGDIVGELGLVQQRLHSASAESTTPIEVLVLTQQSLRQAIDDLPGLGWKLLCTVAGRLTEPPSSGRGLFD